MRVLYNKSATELEYNAATSERRPRLIFIKKGEKEPTQKELLKSFRLHSKTGRPLGGDEFVQKLEKMTGRSLKKLKPGPKKNNKV